MSYADSQLSTGERIIHRERQHWLVLLWGARLPIVAIVAALLLLVLSTNVTGAFYSLLSLLTAVLFLGGLAFLVWATLRYLNQEYVLTNRRVIEVQGVVNKRSTDSSLEKINDAILTQSIFGRIFGFGDLEVLTASEAGIERFRMIVNPIGFKKGDAGRQARVRAGHVRLVPGTRPADSRGCPSGARGVGAAPGNPSPARPPRLRYYEQPPGPGPRRPPRPRLSEPTRMRSRGPSQASRTFVIAGRSRPRNTSRRRRICSGACRRASAARPGTLSAATIRRTRCLRYPCSPTSFRPTRSS